MTIVATTVHTRVHTATYLSDVILGTIGDLLAGLGIDSARLYTDWKQDAAAIKTWIEEQSLAKVILECHQPGGTVSPVIEFRVEYTSAGLGDRAFAAQQSQLARYHAKLARVPAGTAYRLFCTFRTTTHTQMPGWYPDTRAATDGMRSNSFGLLASAPHASASMQVLSR